MKECKCFRLGEGSKWQTYHCDIHNEIVDKKSYSIEEIERAIDDLGFIYDNVKEAIINNLKK
jgi:DNA-directed RNA polymerase subunit N (RpoN/RPB10)